MMNKQQPSLSSIKLLLKPTAFVLSGGLFSAALIAENSANVGLNNQAQALSITPNQHAPMLSSTKLGKLVENSPWQLQLQAKDADKNARPIHFQLLSGPAGFSLSAEGLARWLPSYRDAGEYSLKIRLSDGDKHRDVEALIEVIDQNRAPEWISKNLAPAQEGAPYEANLFASDADNQPLSFSLKKAPKGMVLQGSQLSWTPNFNQAGEHTIEIEVSDGLDALKQSFSLQVNESNRAPYFIGKSELKVKEQALLKLQLKAKDDDGSASPLQFSKLSGPQGLSISASGELSYTPSFNEAGSHQVQVQVSDGDLFSDFNLSIQVENTNRAPEWKTPSLAKAKENQAYRVQLKAQDLDPQDSLQYRLLSAPEGLKISASGVLTFLPNFEQAGEHTVKAELSDGESSVKQSWTLLVENTNRAPRIVSKPELQAFEAKAYTYKLKATDRDNDELSYKLLSDSADGLIQLNGNKIQLSPGYQHAGFYPIHIQVTDNAQGNAGERLSAQQYFELEVKNTNRLPEIAPLAEDQLQLSENSDWRLSLTAKDADQDLLKFSLLDYPEGLSLNKQTLSWKPNFEQSGSHTLSFSVHDGTAMVEETVQLNVTNTNRKPSFQSSPALTAKEAQSYSYPLLALDEDRQDLRFSIISAPEGLKLNDAANALVWEPTYQQSGEHKVQLKVSDGQLEALQDFTVAVENTNRAPVFPEPIVSVLEDSQYTYHVDAFDKDLEDKNRVSVKVISKPDEISFKNNTLSWKPDFKAAGTYPIVLEATDGDLVTRQKFELTVQNNNRKPLVKTQPKLQAHETLAYHYTIEASDADDEALSYSLISGPEGMRLEGQSIHWIPQYSQAGEQTIVLGVNDGIDTTEQRFVVKVDNANRTPSLEAVSAQKVILGDTFKYELLASDVDGDEVNFKLVHGPEGMKLSKKGQLKYKAKTLTSSDEPHMVIIEVSDGELKQRRRFELAVIEASDTAQ